MKLVIAIGPVRNPSTGSRWAMMALTFLPLLALAQGGDKQLHAKADALFAAGAYAQALPMYTQLVSLEPGDHDLNYRLGACSLYGSDDKEKAVGYLKFAVQGPATDNLAWYFLGRAYHLDYQFDAAITAYEHFRGTADKRLLDKFPVDDLVQQCRNGKNLLSNIKDIKVFNKVEVAASDFFRFYDLSDIGGKIVTTPEELMTSLDKKSKERSLVYLPNGGGTIYFSSYGKDGKTGRDIYRTEVLPTGGFSDKVKLAGYVNTDQDEDYAVMAPDGKTFYFCSKGHNSMGGYDVFKSSYDKASGIFGPPENMDFAVNTPADEMLYIVGPDGKQACFASTRASQQDMETVYRIGTTPAPVNLTVIEGTYASAFDITDHKAHIVVEDALTRVMVADVKTDLAGGYLLALPRGGRYSILVEGGPTGKKHLGEVIVPASDRPAAYAQEIKLVNDGGEKLVITNHFDQPLHDDVMALALDEIKRRAKLDVTEEKPVAVITAPEKDAEDPMNAAGFAGNMSVADAVKMAQGQQNDLTQRGIRQGKEADAAFALAASNVDAAEKASTLAQNLVQQASPMEQGPDRDALMTQAAEARQRAKEANDRASAALSAGHDLGAAQQTSLMQATEAAKTSAALAQAIGKEDAEATTDALKQLKAQVEQRAGPSAGISENERARRAASDAEKTAAGKLVQANAQREDEVALANRIARMKRDRDNANGKKKDELSQQLVTLESQHAALLEETDIAFSKAQNGQDDAASARGQVALLRHIQADSAVTSAPAATPDLAGMEQRMSKVKANIAALAIDQRYDASITESAAEKERRTFDWGSSSDELAQAANGGNTEARTAIVPTTISTHAASGTATTSTATDGSRTTHKAATGTAPAQSGIGTSTTTGQAPASGAIETPMARGSGLDQRTPVAGAAAAQTSGSPNSEEFVSIEDTLHATQQDDNAIPAITANPSEGGTNVGLAHEADGAAGNLDLAANGNTPASTEEGEGVTSVASVNDEEEQMFFASNKLAELKQLKQGAAKKSERDSLDVQIHAQEQQMTALHQARMALDARANAQPAADMDQAGPQAVVANAAPRDIDDAGDTAQPERTNGLDPLRYTLLDNDPASLSEQSVDGIIPGFTWRQKQITDAAGNERSKAIAQHQLEVELVDSIDAHLTRQTILLAQHSEDTAVIRSNIDHLKALRSEHVKVAEESLAIAQKPGAPVSRGPIASADLSQMPASAPTDGGSIDSSADLAIALKDDRVIIAPDTSSIYASAVQYLSPKARDAAAINTAEVKLAKADLYKVDSLESILAAVAANGARKDLQQQIDKVKDDLLIRQSGIGERAGFLMKEEYATDQDSLAAQDKALKKLGSPTDGPLAQMASGSIQAAQVDRDHGALLRKNAVKASDIVIRDSLYRLAYLDELHALQKLDQAITVRNYLLKAGSSAKEDITYAEVQQRMAEVPSVVEGMPTGTKSDRAVVSSTADGAVSIVAVGDPKNSPRASDGSDITRDGSNAVLPAIPAKGSANNVIVKSGVDGPAPLVPSGANGDGPSVRPLEGASVAASGRVAEVAGPVSASPLVNEGGPQVGKDTNSAQVPSTVDTVAEVKMPVAQAGAGQGQFFLLRSKARDDRQASDAALADAEARTDQAWVLKDQASKLGGSGGQDDEVTRLSTRSTMLFKQADSLRIVAQALAGSATNYDGQAAAYLASIPAEQAGALMAMEDSRAVAPVVKVPVVSLPKDQAIAELPIPAPSKADTSVQQAPTKTTAPTLAAPETKPQVAAPVPVPVPAPVPVLTVASVVAKPHPAETVPVPAPPVASEEPTPQIAGPVSVPAPAPTPPLSAVEPKPPVVQPVPTPSIAKTAGSTPKPNSAPLPAPTSVSDANAFAVGPDVAPRKGAISMDVPLPKGLVYMVQVGAFRKELPAKAFQDLTPVTGMHVGTGLVRYSAGRFDDRQEAFKAQDLIRNRGYKDAFVVAYMDGQRVTLQQADESNGTGTIAAMAPTARQVDVPKATPAETPVTIPASTTTPATDGEATTLAKYPTSAQALLEDFHPMPTTDNYYNDPTAAPAKQVETVKGLFFTVQVGVYSKPTPLDRLFNITPLNSERTANNKIRYTTGIFRDVVTAGTRKNATVVLGVSDAFVTAYLNGRRIPVGDARALLAKLGPSILVDPELATP